MVYIAAAQVLVTVLLALNLLLCLGIMRRLRQQDTRLAKLESGRSHLPAGTPVPDFTTTTVDGEPITERWFRDGLSVVALLTPGCEACHREAPLLAELLGRPESRDLRALVVVADFEAGGSTDLPAELGARATVVEEPLGGPLLTALGATEFPVFYVVDGEGRVVLSSPLVDDLTQERKTAAASRVGAHPHAVPASR